MCNKIVGIILAILLIVFAFWETVASKWIIAVIGILLLIHAFVCKSCGHGMTEEPMKAKAPAKKKKK